jgi:NAD(P)-dependent dehydrogenase (short-subunit alcohol dehydrogenase family)
MSALDRFRLDGRVAVVTGASSGLGSGFATALAEAGAHLVLGARRADRLAVVGDELRRRGAQALTVPMDVTDPEQCSALVDAGVAEFGKIDVLVNNAGVGPAVPALHETPQQFRAAVDVNLFGAYWMAQACGRVMQPGSSIVNISSVLGLIKSAAPQAAYAASKAGLIGLTRDLAQQWSGRKGIRVNALAPGYFASELTTQVPEDMLMSFVRTHSPLGRLGEQIELDAAVIFLASPASSYITGVTLPVDGGMSGH